MFRQASIIPKINKALAIISKALNGFALVKDKIAVMGIAARSRIVALETCKNFKPL